ncbi:MAG TPA: hypothetical protein PLB55_04940, partial [Prosthecobacter sp.]|nr:hypothetical protein [Prosthecobacter sp.]
VKDRIAPREAVRTQRWKYSRWMEQNPLVGELYDRESGPLEDLARTADPQHAAILKELREKWSHYRAALK